MCNLFVALPFTYKICPYSQILPGASCNWNISFNRYEKVKKNKEPVETCEKVSKGLEPRELTEFETVVQPKLSSADDPFFVNDYPKKPAGVNHLMQR